MQIIEQNKSHSMQNQIQRFKGKNRVKTESAFAANKSLSKIIQEPFVSKDNNTIETKLVCIITDSTNFQVNVPYTPIITSMMFMLQTMMYNPKSK